MRCPQCGQVFATVPDTVPGAKGNNSSNTPCDVCIKKNKNVSAVIYCGSCDKKFCSQHKQFHAEMHDDHQTCTIQEYRTKANKMKVKFCDKHGDQPYSVGCRDCLNLCCVKCLSGLKNCTSTGASHKLLSIEELFAELMKDINKLTSDLLNKEGELSSLSKKAGKSISEFETETDTFIELLHTTRDEQLQAITLEYQRLETQFRTQRRARQAQINNFLEEEIDGALSMIHLERLRMEAKLKHSHQVDVIMQYRHTKSEFGQLIDMEMPELALEIPTLHTLDLNRKIEINIGQSFLLSVLQFFPFLRQHCYTQTTSQLGGTCTELRQVFLEPGSAEYQQVLESFNINVTQSAPVSAVQTQSGHIGGLYQTQMKCWHDAFNSFGNAHWPVQRNQPIGNQLQIEIYRNQNTDHYRKYMANVTRVLNSKWGK
ncbi:hypothetical protein EB796_007092 [Bugula neritina]|uniref:B box-type domain-containing protein n=1 Tax=Bugula neritina TaxID=10212 RepID=A0A7J7K9S4_BUGNE|nr:hypothetical protein EB796_007092 [Bugula neritina]